MLAQNLALFFPFSWSDAVYIPMICLLKSPSPLWLSFLQLYNKSLNTCVQSIIFNWVLKDSSLHIVFCHCDISGDYIDLGFIHYKELRLLWIARAIFLWEGKSHPKQQKNHRVTMTHCIGLQITRCNKESKEL